MNSQMIITDLKVYHLVHPLQMIVWLHFKKQLRKAVRESTYEFFSNCISCYYTQPHARSKRFLQISYDIITHVKDIGYEHGNLSISSIQKVYKQL